MKDIYLSLIRSDVQSEGPMDRVAFMFVSLSESATEIAHQNLTKESTEFLWLRDELSHFDPNT